MVAASRGRWGEAARVWQGESTKKEHWRGETGGWRVAAGARAVKCGRWGWDGGAGSSPPERRVCTSQTNACWLQKQGTLVVLQALESVYSTAPEANGH